MCRGWLGFILPENCEISISIAPDRLRRRDRQQAGDAAAADIVDAGEHDLVALDLDHDRRAQAFAVELAQRHGEVGGVAVPADGEVRAKRDLRRTLRTANGDLPFAPARRSFVLLGKLFAQGVGGLLESESPLIQHETVISAAHGAGDMIEVGVLKGM